MVVVRPRDAVQWALYYEPILPTDSLEQLDRIPESERDARFFVRKASLLLGAGRLDEARARSRSRVNAQSRRGRRRCAARDHRDRAERPGGGADQRARGRQAQSEVRGGEARAVVRAPGEPAARSGARRDAAGGGRPSRRCAGAGPARGARTSRSATSIGPTMPRSVPPRWHPEPTRDRTRCSATPRWRAWTPEAAKVAFDAGDLARARQPARTAGSRPRQNSGRAPGRGASRDRDRRRAQPRGSDPPQLSRQGVLR